MRSLNISQFAIAVSKQHNLVLNKTAQKMCTLPRYAFIRMNLAISLSSIACHVISSMHTVTVDWLEQALPGHGHLHTPWIDPPRGGGVLINSSCKQSWYCRMMCLRHERGGRGGRLANGCTWKTGKGQGEFENDDVAFVVFGAQKQRFVISGAQAARQMFYSFL